MWQAYKLLVWGWWMQWAVLRCLWPWSFKNNYFLESRVKWSRTRPTRWCAECKESGTACLNSPTATGRQNMWTWQNCRWHENESGPLRSKDHLNLGKIHAFIFIWPFLSWAVWWMPWENHTAGQCLLRKVLTRSCLLSNTSIATSKGCAGGH